MRGLSIASYIGLTMLIGLTNINSFALLGAKIGVVDPKAERCKFGWTDSTTKYP